MTKPLVIVIGGFGVNYIAINWLDELYRDIHFIDINTNTFFSNFEKGIAYLKKYLATSNIVIGYSMGGLFAIGLAAKFPQLITQIILINSTPKFIQEVNWHGIRDADFNKLVKYLDERSIDQFMAYFIKLASYPNLEIELNYQSLYGILTKSHLNDLLMILFTTDLRGELIKLGSKLILINSKNDCLVPTNSIGVTYKQYIINDSTHLRLNSSQIIPILKSQILC